MPSIWFSSYFNELGAYAIPKQFVFNGSCHKDKALIAYQGVRWIDMGSAALDEFLTVLFDYQDINIHGISPPRNEKMWLRKAFMQYLIDSQDGQLSWVQIVNDFTPIMLREVSNKESNVALRSRLDEILDGLSKYQAYPSLLDLFEFIGFERLRHVQALCEHYTLHAESILLALKGAARLGGEQRMRRALDDLINSTEHYPCHAQTVFEVLGRSDIDRNLYWKRMPSRVKGRLLEADLGM